MSAPCPGLCRHGQPKQRRLAHKAGFGRASSWRRGRSGRCLDLKYLLQAVDDPSVLVPAEKVWEESRGGVLRFWEGDLKIPRKGSSPIWRVWPHSSHRWKKA